MCLSRSRDQAPRGVAVPRGRTAECREARCAISGRRGARLTRGPSIRVAHTSDLTSAATTARAMSLHVSPTRALSACAAGVVPVATPMLVASRRGQKRLECRCREQAQSDCPRFPGALFMSRRRSDEGAASVCRVAGQIAACATDMRHESSRISSSGWTRSADLVAAPAGGRDRVDLA